jgi:hypothetical protein
MQLIEHFVIIGFKSIIELIKIRIIALFYSMIFIFTSYFIMIRYKLALNPFMKLVFIFV